MKTLLQTIAIVCMIAVPAGAQERPNILVLTVDDMNCDSVGVFGCAVPDTTPNMDQFAKAAMRFDHAHVHASSCIPSRNVVMTGRYLFNSGIEGFYQLPKQQVTYKTTPDILRENGYFTMIRGKSSHSSPYHPYPAWDINFDEELKANRINIRDTRTFYEYTKKGIDAAKAAGKPFYFSMDIHDPHTALYSFSYKKGTVSTDLLGQDRDNPPSRIFKPEEVIVPSFLPDTPLSRLEVTAYYNSVRRADDSFGNVIRALKDSGVYDNTFVVFFSDHGMPFPFAKTAMYYHSTHTPLMIRWPGVTKAGAKDNQHVIGTVDLLPTLLEAVEIEQPEGLDGRSFASITKGERQTDREFTYVMYEENVGGNRQPMRAVVSKDYSYICNLWSDGERRFATATRGMATTAEIERLANEGDKRMQQRLHLFNHSVPEQFFDLNQDPDGLDNLIDSPHHQVVIQKHQRAMVQLMESSNDPMRDVFHERDNKKTVAAYLNQLDVQSKARKAKPEIHKRGHQQKSSATKQPKSRKSEQRANTNKPVDGPNVVLIYADDMGWGDVGYHGVNDILTPNIDRLATDGVQFSQGYVSASVCGPSRSGLMTGVYQQRMGCGENPNTSGFPDDPKFPFAGVPKSQPMLSEILQSAGYRCGMVGKWHLGLHESMRPHARGFDSYYGFLNGAHDYEKARPVFGKNKGLWPLFRNNKMQGEYEGYLTDTFSDEAVRFIEGQRDTEQPFFLYVAYNAVHHPWQVPDKYLQRTKHLSDIEDRRFFAGMVLAMDDGVGRIMQALEKSGVSDDTLVMFISDNGSPRGQGLDHPTKDMQKERGDCTMSSPGPFRGFKGDTYEGGIRVPFVMRWPGKIKPGSRYDHPVVNLDVAPTILSQLGIKQTPQGFPFDGVDLMPYLSGKKEDQRPHDLLYWRRDDDYAIRNGDWKLAWNDASCPADSDTMLFNLVEDPGEHHDLSGKHADIKQQLQDQFDAWDSLLPPSQCWGSPKNRKPNPDAPTEAPMTAAEPKRTIRKNAQELSAVDATLHGTEIRKGPQVISHWREPSEWAEWSFTAKASGPHRVFVQYAAPHPANIVLSVAGQKFTSILPSRQNWGDTGEQLVGQVDLEADHPYQLIAKPGQSWRAVNLRSVVLEPLSDNSKTRSLDRPNVVLIMADDLGAECIGAYGCTAYQTPALDHLASVGMRFDYCFAQPLCTPSRVKIMTGRYAHRNYTGFGKFDTREITFGKVLQNAGYRTCMTGKWQLGGDYATPIEMGFDEYCLQNAIVPAEPFERSTRGRERYWSYPVIVANGKLYESEQQYGPDMLSEYATKFIKRQADRKRPFFLYYPMILPHSPFAPSPRSVDGDKSGAPISELKYFKDMVEYVDVLVGRIVETLEATGQRENTLIMFTGDNGTTYPVKVTAPAPEGYPKVLGIDKVRHANQLPRGVQPTRRDGAWEGPLTQTDHGDIPGGKDLMNHRGTHVPLIIDWPQYRGTYQQIGHACNDLIDFSDFFTTIADLAEAELPTDRIIDGVSFAERLKGGEASKRDFVFCHYWGFGRNKKEARESIRNHRWKLYDDGSFFDLQKDIEETSPLQSFDAEAKAARRQLTRAREKLRSN
ncbi:Arylsulfatase [Planctomycetes bacterium CA13]|uniref:Arylsulfatase n=1 Tax=Novipirellula herctigrandis TaxID=2527986 RepID=A0A5C5ZD48_9BACT|nr:Arylsulfatase [Planctomycetes bacterium CA13]